MGKNKPLKNKKAPEGVFLYDDHRLVTRRDFMAAGLIQFSATLLAPSFLATLIKSSVAHAACADPAAAAASTRPIFGQLNLAGGAGLAANFVPRDRGGQLIPSFNLMGLGTAATLSTKLVDEGGAAGGFFNASGFLAGMRAIQAQAGSPLFLANTAIIGVVCQSRDDSNMNRFDISSLVHAAGLKGTELPILSSANFGQQPALIPPPQPLNVSRVADLNSAVGVQGPLGDTNNLSQAQLNATFKLINNLSEGQVQRLLASTTSQITNELQLQENVGCASEKTAVAVARTRPPTDPTLQATLDSEFGAQAADINTIWGINANTNKSSQDAVFGSVVFNSMVRQAGSFRLNMGGYDYHDGSRTSGDTRDTNAGQVVGRILRSAAALGQKLFLYVSTDGSVRSAESNLDTAPWVSDRGQAGLTLIIAYDPAGRPALSRNADLPASYVNQIGYLTTGQAADQRYINNWNDELAALAVFANYMRFAHGAGWKQTFKDIVGPASIKAGLSGVPISDADLDKIIRI